MTGPQAAQRAEQRHLAAIVTALEVLGLALLAAAAGVAGAAFAHLAVGLLAAALVVLGGAWLAERPGKD